MTVSDIVAKILNHQIEGLMIHEQFAEYYRFLSLESFAQVHDWHYERENVSFKCIRDYYIKHYNMLPPKISTSNPNIIPDGWYRYNREDVDANTKKTSVKNGLATWRKWEEETKDLYQHLYSELIEMKECAFAFEVEKLITDVDRELSDVISYLIRNKMIDYDINELVRE